MAKSQNESNVDANRSVEDDLIGRQDWVTPQLQRLEASHAENVPGSGGDIASFAFAS